MFHVRLEQLREKNNLSKAELCRRLSIPPTTYSGYALGTREPDIETIRRFAEFYNVSVDYLINGFEGNSFNERTNNFIEGYLGLSDSEKKILESTLDLIKKK